VAAYIRKQKKHHQNLSTREEMRRFPEAHGMEFDPEYFKLDFYWPLSGTIFIPVLYPGFRGQRPLHPELSIFCPSGAQAFSMYPGFRGQRPLHPELSIFCSSGA
jgi:hypothetical protein